MNYNKTSKESILNYSKKLEKNCISNLIDTSFLNIKLDKGGFGKYVEECFFNYKPNSDKNPDFPDASWENDDRKGLELKTTEVYKLKNGKTQVKWKLNLNSINYWELVKEEFESSYFLKKNYSTLILFYYNNSKEFSSRVFDLTAIWEIPKKDLIIIKRDWEKIKDIVENDDANNLSEKLTSYLGAGTAGNSGEMTTQPNSNEKARRRKFTFKSNYIKSIYKILKNPDSFSSIANDKEINEKSIVQLITERLEKYINKSVFDLAKEYEEPKNKFDRVVKKIIGASDSKKEIEELEKAGITIKTVRINRDNKIEQHMSFPAFEYKDIYDEEWDYSETKEIFQNTLLIVFFKENNNGEYKIDKLKFWNLSTDDIKELEIVYNKLRDCVINGNIVEKVDKKVHNKFPKSAQSYLSHVRNHSRYGYLNPKGKTPANISQLPMPDKKTGWTSFSKFSFWLNNSYILDIYKNNGQISA